MCRLSLILCWALVAQVDSSTTVRLRESPNSPFSKVVGYYARHEDAVDLASFDTHVPYGRSNEWNQMLTKSPAVHHRVGQIFKHAVHGYHAAIVGIDPRPTAADEQWHHRMKTSELAQGTEQPFYWCLVDTRDRSPPLMAYVPQENIVASADPAIAEGFQHPDTVVFFDRAQPEKIHGRDEMGFLRGVAQGMQLDFSVGHRVEVRVGESWHQATVEEPVHLANSPRTVTVRTETGGVMNVGENEIRESQEFVYGDVIEARWKKGQVWYQGKVQKVIEHKGQSKSFAILFDDGDKETLPQQFIRFHGEAERERRSHGTDFFTGAVAFNGFSH